YHHTAEAAHHEEHHDYRLFGLIVFLIAEGMIFMGLFGAYLAFRSTLPVWPPEGTPELELLLPGVNTINLIASSFVIHNADTAIKKNDVRGMQMWFA
ncbi:heme-copper oxidase subunit III, partial [Fischerella thermalis WC217]